MKEKTVQKIVEVKHYIAEDGKEFETYHECKAYDDKLFYDKYNKLFNFEWTDSDEDNFNVTYKAEYHQEFLNYISKILNERFNGNSTSDKDDYLPENLEKYFKDECAPLMDNHIYNIDSMYTYENDDWDRLDIFIEDMTDTGFVEKTVKDELIKNDDFKRILKEFKEKHPHVDASKIMAELASYYREIEV